MQYKNKRVLGSQKEAEASEYLIKERYEILEHNFRSQYGEIDIVAKENGYLVFVEVKYRSNTKVGQPHEAVDLRKMKRIIKTAQYYMFLHRYSEFTPCRFDVIVSLEEKMEVIKNAFDAF